MTRVANPGDMRVLSISHQADAGPGAFAEVLAQHDLELVGWSPQESEQPPDLPATFDAILTFGGSVNPDEEREHPWLRREKRFLAETLRNRVPTLAVCLGAELLSEAAGAPAREAPHPEIGWYQVDLTGAAGRDPLLGWLPKSFEALQWHSYALGLPSAATELARSNDSVQAFRIGSHAWALQFYVDVNEPDFRAWLARDATSEPALSIGVDPEDLTEETLERLQAWQATGREILERFLAIAENDSASRRG